MSSSTAGSGSEPKPQPQPVRPPEPGLQSQQVWEPVFQPVSRSEEPGSQTKSVSRTGAGQRSELQGLRPGLEAGPSGGAGSFTYDLPEHMSALGPIVPLVKLESGSVPKPLPLTRSGSVKTSGSPPSGSSVSATVPMASLALYSYKGWLLKWTNYLKGYQRRWFVLGNGLLSYYRNQGEMAHTCRGTINLATAHIDTEDSCGILLFSGARTYHLKANSEVDRQQWITVLEMAKAKAIPVMKIKSGIGYLAQGIYMSGVVIV